MANGIVKNPQKGGWQRISIPDANSQYSGNYIEFNKRGRVVQVSLFGLLKSTTSSIETIQLGTLDSSLFPFVTAFMRAIDLNGFNKGIEIVISTSGQVTLYINGPAGIINGRIFGTYLTDR